MPRRFAAAAWPSTCARYPWWNPGRSSRAAAVTPAARAKCTPFQSNDSMINDVRFSSMLALWGFRSVRMRPGTWCLVSVCHPKMCTMSFIQCPSLISILREKKTKCTQDPSIKMNPYFEICIFCFVCEFHDSRCSTVNTRATIVSCTAVMMMSLPYILPGTLRSGEP